MKMALTFIIFFYLLLFHIGQVVNANEEDRKRRNERYDTKEYMYGKEPIKLLKENINLLTKGKALVLAMGEGRNAVFLAKNGFEVDGCDISEIAIEKTKILAKEHNVKLNAFVADLEEYRIPNNKYDLYNLYLLYAKESYSPNQGSLEDRWYGCV